MKEFRFLSDSDDDYEDIPEEFVHDIGQDCASWMWDVEAGIQVGTNYDLVISQTNGIRDFLGEFNPNMIVIVNSITGPNGRVHTGLTLYQDGWGFDVTSDPLIIVYLRFIP